MERGVRGENFGPGIERLEGTVVDFILDLTGGKELLEKIKLESLSKIEQNSSRKWKRILTYLFDCDGRPRTSKCPNNVTNTNAHLAIIAYFSHSAPNWWFREVLHTRCDFRKYVRSAKNVEDVFGSREPCEFGRTSKKGVQRFGKACGFLDPILVSESGFHLGMFCDVTPHTVKIRKILTERGRVHIKFGGQFLAALDHFFLTERNDMLQYVVNRILVLELLDEVVDVDSLLRTGRSATVVGVDYFHSPRFANHARCHHALVLLITSSED